MPVIRPFARPLLALMLVIPVTACLWDTDEAAVGRQGWSGGQRTAWYWGTQGSRLMPQTWFEALEQPGGAAPFADMAYLASFGFLDPAEGRAGARPIGFATDRQDDHAFKVTGLRWYEGQAGDKSHAEPWIGLNCAACHTARMTYGGVTTTVDGAPNLLDFQSFIEALDASLAATRTDPARWEIGRAHV